MKFNEYFIIFCVVIDGRKIYDAMHEFVQTREQAEEEVREYYKRMNYPCEVFGAFKHPEVMAILANRPDWMNVEAEKEIRERMKDFPEPQEYAFNTLEQPETETAEADETETEPETATTNEEESRMENVLYYEERGCFHDEMRYVGVSDMQNFRIFCEFEGKDGKHIYAEFGGYDREPKKINGKKVPGFKNRLNANLSYEDERGCWGFTPAAPYMGIDAAAYNYTREDVLRFINAVSAEHFTAIQPRLILDCKNHYQNFTGSGLMVHIMQDWKKRWAKREDIAREYEVLNCFGSTFLRIRGQVYEYAGIEAEKQNPENAPGYNDYKVRFDRITDTERAEKIKAQGIETIGILTA